MLISFRYGPRGKILEAISLTPIGKFKSCYTEKFATPRGSGVSPSSWGVIEIASRYECQESFFRLSEFSHLWVIFFFHKNTNQKFKSRIRPPRLLGESVGVFASRSPHRPNSMGLSVVKIEKIEKNLIYVSGIDILDGTPVLDIKPYIPEYDCMPMAEKGWTQDIRRENLNINYSTPAQDFIKSLKDSKYFQMALEESLRPDPRPSYMVNAENIPRKFRYQFAGYSIEVEISGDNANILTIE